MKIHRTDRIITRNNLRENRDILFLFGDNSTRKGLGGQAKEMRGESNSLGIVTKKFPSNEKDSFYSDEDFYVWLELFSGDMENLAEKVNSGKYKTIVIPPLGTGLADLPNRAPKIWNYLKIILDNL
jgi:hypothetical protein